jgi:hypothetical protein
MLYPGLAPTAWPLAEIYIRLQLTITFAPAWMMAILILAYLLSD